MQEGCLSGDSHEEEACFELFFCFVLVFFFGLWGEFVGQAEGAWSTNVAPSCRKELIGKVLTSDKDDLLNWGVGIF